MIIFCILISFVYCIEGTIYAGFSKVDITLPIGVPLAGYDNGNRSTEFWPIPDFGNYTTFMTPSTGVIDSQYAKVLLLNDGTTTIGFVSLDLLCVDRSLAFMAYTIAKNQGFSVPFNNIVFCGSHTHSGPGAWNPRTGIQVPPTTDIFDFDLFTQLSQSIANALVSAEKNGLKPVQIAIGMDELLGVTHNRRAGLSPYVQEGTIDPHIGIIRVDDLTGKPLVTLWNFAIHGICYDEYNLKSSADIMGYANIDIENTVGGISMFVNGDAGDINPIYGKVCKEPPNWIGSRMIAQKVVQVRENLKSNLTTLGTLHAVSIQKNFAPVQPNWTLERIENCTSGGFLDICTICKFLGCDVNTHFPESWWDATPRFTAFSVELNNVKTVMASIPGEAIVELGWWIRNDTLDMGFQNTFLVGYTNNYMGYFTTPREYVIGGYESMLTLYGIDTAIKIREGVKTTVQALLSRE